MKKRISLIGLSSLLAIAMTLLFIGFAVAASPYTIEVFDQCANNLGIGPCTWTNGNLQKNIALYTEGEATIQRIYLKDIPSGPQTIILEYKTTKGGVHAYDYLTDYNLSENWVTKEQLCTEPKIPYAECVLWSQNQSSPIPDDPNNSLDTSGGHITIFNGLINGVGAPTLVSGDYSGDSITTVVVTFTANSDGRVLIVFGGHLAKTSEYPSGEFGAGYINGASFHIGVANMDNQVSTAVVKPAQLTIVKSTDTKNSSIFTYTISSNSIALTSPFNLMDDHPDNSNTPPSQITFSDLVEGVFTVTEQGPLPGDWLATAIECSGTYISNGETIPANKLDYLSNVPGGSATLVLNLANDQNVTCIFYNHSPTAVTLSSVGGNQINGLNIPLFILFAVTLIIGWIFYRGKSRLTVK
jgi:hypothetical protein